MALEQIHQVPVTTCPLCGHKFDKAGGVNCEEAPKEGDVTICIMCAGVLIFDRSRKARAATDAERYEILRHSRAARHAVHAVRMVRTMSTN